MSKSIIDRIAVPASRAARGPRRRFALGIDRLHPSIRIAHVMDGALNIPSRVIFDYEFVLILKGQGELSTRAGRLELRPNRLFVLRPFEAHSFASPPDSPGRHLAIHADLAPGFPPFSGSLGRRPPYEVRLSHGLALPRYVDLSPGHLVIQCLMDIVPIRAANEKTSSLEASTLLTRAVLQLLKSRRRGPDPSDNDERNRARMDRVAAYIEGHLAGDLSVPALAEVADLSLAHLARVFMRWTGMTPANYVRTARVNRARGMLGDPDPSIKKIALAVGFKNPYHFSRVFTQVDGLTPTLYRKATLAGIKR